MFECLILGDSIGVGLHKQRPECVAYVKNGINTEQFNKQYSGEFFSNSVIISLGSNDHKGVKTRKELEALRTRVVAKKRVYWILPAIKSDIQAIVKDVATKNGDVVLSITSLQSDGIHPSLAGFKDLGEKSK